MNAQQLKNAILQEAIEGRLVPQDPNDEPASALLARIRKEKEKLVKEGKLKKKDLEVKPISEDEIPFEIPESWEWVRLKDIIVGTGAGKSPNCEKRPKTESEWGVITTTAIQYCAFLPNENKVLPSTFVVNEFQVVKDKDLLITRAGPKNRTGIVCVVDKPYDRLILSDKTVRIDYIRGYSNPFFLMYSLNNPSIHDVVMSATVGMAESQVNISQSSIQKIVIPFPPLAEQHRIVEKIEELLPKVEEYGKAQEALDKLNEELPERLKKSILQEAIEGRLVPRDPNDEPASVLLDKIRKEKEKLVKDGKLKKKDLIETPITEDEIPFDIPESWEWVRINFLGEVITGGTPPKSELKYYGKDYPFFKPADLEQGINTISSTDSLSVEGYEHSRKLPKDSILVTCIGSIGKTGLIRKEGTCNQQINAIVPDKQIIVPEYLYYSCISPFFQESMWDSSSSTTLAILNKNKFSQLLAPLPPLAEQHRIVAKIEEVFAEIDKLKK